jgi:hypothetical protein
MLPTLVAAAIGHTGEPFQQVSPLDRRAGRIRGGMRVGLDIIQRARAGLGDGRMQPQRSSGSWPRSVRGRSSYRSFVRLLPRHAEDHRVGADDRVTDQDDLGTTLGLPRQPFNWTYYVFYGGDIRQQAVNWLLDQLRDIARIPASDEDGDRVQGLFLASHEVDGMSEWQVRDGRVLITPADSRYRYLDA